VWRRVTPNLGASVPIEGLRDEYRRAAAIPEELASFKQLRLNIWGVEADAVITPEVWAKNDAEPLCEGPCYIGVDLSSKIDLTAAVAWFPETGSILPAFWLPADGIELRKQRDVFDYPRFVASGHLTLTAGSRVDQRAVRKKINEWAEAYDLVEIGYDSWNAAQFEAWLSDEDGLDVTEVRQGSKTLSEPFKDIVGRARDGVLRHGGHPVLKWCAMNLKARRDPNDNWAPAKDPNGRKRNDGMVALITAHARAMDPETGFGTRWTAVRTI
jgi:phage terminase large subunit-like protein